MAKSGWTTATKLYGRRGNELLPVVLRYRPWWDAAVSVTIDGQEPVVEESAADLFEAFLEIRRELESRGVFLCCVGAELDVWPSGMTRQRGQGNLAYRKSELEELPVLVDIFAPTDCSEVVSVEVQRRRHLGSWRRFGGEAPQEVAALATEHGGQWVYEVVGDGDVLPDIALSTIRRSWHVGSSGELDGVWLSNPDYDGPDELLGDVAVHYVVRPRSPFG